MSFLQVVQAKKGTCSDMQPVPALHWQQHSKQRVFSCDVACSQCALSTFKAHLIMTSSRISMAQSWALELHCKISDTLCYSRPCNSADCRFPHSVRWHHCGSRKCYSAGIVFHSKNIYLLLQKITVGNPT